jgi:hypothetical protein
MSLGRNRVPLEPLTVSSLQTVPADVDRTGPARLGKFIRARLRDLVAERYRLSEFLQSAYNRTPIRRGWQQCRGVRAAMRISAGSAGLVRGHCGRDLYQAAVGDLGCWAPYR